MDEGELKKEIQLLKAENERLKEQLSASAETTVDQFVIVQQVQAIVNGYMALRDQVAKLEAELTTRNEDNRRLQKMVSELHGASPEQTKR